MIIDFETYSEAGLAIHPKTRNWVALANSAGKKGLPAVGAAVYSEHESTEVICLAYNEKIWLPGMPAPTELFEFISSGGTVRARNSMFEYLVWNNVCVTRYGFPPLPIEQLVDSAAESRAFGMPASLDGAAKVVGGELKMSEGKRLIQKFSVPRNPTKSNASRRHICGSCGDSAMFYGYCLQDVAAEKSIRTVVPPLSYYENKVFALDQKINARGVGVDVAGVRDFAWLVGATESRFGSEIPGITGGALQDVRSPKKIMEYCSTRGVNLENVQKSTVERVVSDYSTPGDVKRLLELRLMLGAASVKKLYALSRMTSKDGRMRGMLQYYGAATGRWAGRGPQPQNFPNSGASVKKCRSCGSYCSSSRSECPVCRQETLDRAEWGNEATEFAIELVKGRNMDQILEHFDDPVALVGGSLRGLFKARKGCDFICSDYSAIEAVVLAMLSGETWRQEVFRGHGKIYEMSASKITGISFEEMLSHKENTGEHHPMRKKVGKVAELASGYQGGYNAWLQFGADKHLSEPEIRDAIKAWRAASPNVVKFWYGLENAAVSATLNPGSPYSYRDITYKVKRGALYCTLPSGRNIVYQSPRTRAGTTPWGKPCWKLSYMGVNSLTRKWEEIQTYGGKLTENVVQAVARDILAHALLQLEKAGYPVAMHVHDEIISEVPKGKGSVEEFERIMATMPSWAQDYPIRASGGWRGKRYRKD